MGTFAIMLLSRLLVCWSATDCATCLAQAGSTRQGLGANTGCRVRSKVIRMQGPAASDTRSRRAFVPVGTTRRGQWAPPSAPKSQASPCFPGSTAHRLHRGTNPNPFSFSSTQDQYCSTPLERTSDLLSGSQSGETHHPKLNHRNNVRLGKARSPRLAHGHNCQTCLADSATYPTTSAGQRSDGARLDLRCRIRVARVVDGSEN